MRSSVAQAQFCERPSSVNQQTMDIKDLWTKWVFRAAIDTGQITDVKAELNFSPTLVAKIYS